MLLVVVDIVVGRSASEIFEGRRLDCWVYCIPKDDTFFQMAVTTKCPLLWGGGVKNSSIV